MLKLSTDVVVLFHDRVLCNQLYQKYLGAISKDHGNIKNKPPIIYTGSYFDGHELNPKNTEKTKWNKHKNKVNAQNIQVFLNARFRENIAEWTEEDFANNIRGLTGVGDFKKGLDTLDSDFQHRELYAPEMNTDMEEEATINTHTASINSNPHPGEENNGDREHQPTTERERAITNFSKQCRLAMRHAKKYAEEVEKKGTNGRDITANAREGDEKEEKENKAAQSENLKACQDFLTLINNVEWLKQKEAAPTSGQAKNEEALSDVEDFLGKPPGDGLNM